jgi:hypothetical protein
MSGSHWIDPDRIFDCVVALTDDVIFVCSPPAEEAKAIQSSLEQGHPASAAIKNDPTAILITSITKVAYDLLDDDVDITWRAGKESESKNITFSSREERDDFAAQLTEQLPDFESRTVEWGPVRAALGPLAFGSFAGFMTWVLHGLAIAVAGGAEAEISGRRSGMKELVVSAVDVIGPLGVLSAGGMVVALTAAYLVKRVKTPPIMTTLTRSP